MVVLSARETFEVEGKIDYEGGSSPLGKTDACRLVLLPAEKTSDVEDQMGCNGGKLDLVDDMVDNDRFPVTAIYIYRGV